MPLYNANVPSNSPVPALQPGDALGVTLFNEIPAAGALSQQIFVARKDNGQSASISLEFTFPSNPGVFEFDILDADTDAIDNYIVIPAVGQVINAAAGPGGVKFTARVELSPFRANFLAVQCVTPNANAVNSLVRAFSS
jgi:hypothetical protein